MAKLITSLVLALTVLSAVLPFLKICGSTWVATWSWWQIAAPVWLLWTLTLAGCLLFLLVKLLTNLVRWPA